jgi:hypothetical protein
MQGIPMNKFSKLIGVVVALAFVFSFSTAAVPAFAALKAGPAADHENLGDWYDIG